MQRARGLPTNAAVSVAVGETTCGPDNTEDREIRRVEVKLDSHGNYITD